MQKPIKNESKSAKQSGQGKSEFVCAEKWVPAELYNPRHYGIQKRNRGNPAGSARVKYKDVVLAFDIETTRLENIEQSFMWVWMLQVGLDVTVVGRTWEQFTALIDLFCQQCDGPNVKFVCYVHNLSYEFQFLRGIYDFQPKEVFCTDRRKILKCDIKNIEFRCSYLHTNMSLGLYTDKMDVAHKKLVGELDYKKIRWPYTPIDEKTELPYCLNDVRGLVEAIYTEMCHDGDNLYTIPLTSTGYVRRDVKNALRAANDRTASRIAPTFAVYEELREAFRGGNAHANRRFSARVQENVKSEDRSSSYPDVLCNCEYPMTEFLPEENVDADRLAELMETRHKALLFRCALWDVELIEDCGCPYLAIDKCRNIDYGEDVAAEYWKHKDNGRILNAAYLETTLTDVDFRIILKQYTFSAVDIWDCYSARYGKLPQPIIETNIAYYKAKTELKGVEGKEVLYNKAKNKLNSIYGMMAQNPVRENIQFVNGEFIPAPDQNRPAEYAKAVKNSFVAYQWGVWCTAWARYRLQEGIDLAGEGYIYCDTDSVKYIGDVDFSEYNKERIRESKNSGACAVDPNGVMHYMGVYERDGEYTKFCTMGAKKYCYEIAGKLHATISGVSKKDGGKELEAAGGISAFKEGFVFRDAGGTESVYNDNTNMEYLMPNGEYLYIGPNVVIRDSTYTLGLAGEYSRLLQFYYSYGSPFTSD